MSNSEIPVRLFADFNDEIENGKVLFSKGTLTDIEKMNIKLIAGMKIILDNQEGIETDGYLEYSDKYSSWLMVYDHTKKLVDTSPVWPETSVNYAAREMAKIQIESNRKNAEFQGKREFYRKLLIDNAYRYRSDLKQFKSYYAVIYTIGSRSNSVLSYLFECQEKYTDAVAFYNMYCSTPSEDKLMEGYKEILNFVTSELDKGSEITDPINPLSMIDPFVIESFESAEKKADLHGATLVKIAAFVRELWLRNYFKDHKYKKGDNTPAKVLNKFAFARYRKETDNQFSAHKKEVEEYQKRLQICFK